MSPGPENRTGGTKHLNNARSVVNDEYYTRLEDIEKEMVNYDFAGKVVYCNCDDPMVSQFVYYFFTNFEKLGLKRLIASCYKPRPIDLLTIDVEFESATCLDYSGGNNDRIDDYIKHLVGDGDFRSAECIALLEQCDVVVTNPPFSLFVKFTDLMHAYSTQFIIIGPLSGAGYKSMFSRIRSGEVYPGAGGRIHNYFTSDGGLKSMSNTLWFVSYPRKQKMGMLPLTETYKGNESKYPVYDDYDAINVDRTKDIPMDFTGVMGVPISFMEKYNIDQFELLDRYDPHIGNRNVFRRIMVRNKNPTQMKSRPPN